MDTSSRVFFGAVVLAIIVLIFQSPIFEPAAMASRGVITIVLSIVAALGAVLMLLVTNPFGKVSPQVHVNALNRLHRHAAAQLHTEQAKTKAERAQKKRFITLWRKAKGYTK